MGTYYNDVKEITGFTEESLKKGMRLVFDCGVATFRLLGEDTEIANAKYACLSEVLEHMMASGFPNLDELKSGGALQRYVELLRRETREDGTSKGH